MFASVSNGSRQPSSSLHFDWQFGLVWFQTRPKTRTVLVLAGCYPDRTLNHGFLAVLEPDRGSNFQVAAALALMKYLSSDCILIWWICRICSSTRSFTSRIQISHPTDFRGVAVKHGPISSEIRGFSIATQPILVVLHIWKWKLKERLKLHNLHIHHVTIRSELKYLIGANNAALQWPGFKVEPGPSAMVRGIHMVKPLQQFGPDSNRNPEPF